MNISVTHDDGTGRDITAEVLRLWDVVAHDIRFSYDSSLEEEDVDAAVTIAAVCNLSDGPALIAAVEEQKRLREEEERRRDEWERTRAERAAASRKAAAQLAAEMREAEPKLVAAGWTDDELVQLRYMRNAGLA